MQKTMMKVFPVLMTVMTGFQPAAVQLYFVTTGMTGFVTATLLRKPTVREYLGIRSLPTPESQKLYSKVVSGEVELSKIKGADGRIRYQAPSSPASASVASAARPNTLVHGLHVKSRASVPPHMGVAAIHADKAKAEAPKSTWESVKDLRNMPKKMGEKYQKWADPRDPEVRRKQDAKDRQKAALYKYEQERKRALKGE